MNIDPAWQLAQNEVNSILCIPTLKFVQKFSYITLLAHDLIKIHSNSFDQLLNQYKNITTTYIKNNPQFYTVPNNMTESDAMKILNKSGEEAITDRLHKYKYWILNQSLVSLCTFFDAFLEEIVELILSKDMTLLYDNKASKDITLQKMIEKGIDNIIEEIRHKEVGKFTHLAGIKNRVNYLESKFQIPVQSIFDWNNFNDKDKISHWTLDYLSEVYEKRNSIVHDDKNPIQSITELDEIGMVFSKLIFNITGEISRKYSIMNDMNRQILFATLYQQYRSEYKNVTSE